MECLNVALLTTKPFMSLWERVSRSKVPLWGGERLTTVIRLVFSKANSDRMRWNA